MGKRRIIKYNYSGEPEDVQKLLRQFSTNTLLKRINGESRNILQQDDDKNLPAVRYVSYTICNANNSIYASKIKNTYITAWGLVDLAYYAIMYSNDFRGIDIEHDEELYMLFDAVGGLNERNESLFLKSEDTDENKLLFYVWGFAGEQFKMEAPGKVFNNAGRELFILFESSKHISEEKIDISQIIYDETGFSWDKILYALFLGWAFFTANNEYKSELMNFDNGLLSESEFLRIIDRYTCNYDEVRASSFTRQILYKKPYIKTKKNELLSVSPYLNLFAYEHSIFWVIREYYRKKSDQGFTSYFGKCFEAYFSELMYSCLDAETIKKIPEEKVIRADWKVSIGKFHFIIEQKSTIMRLAAKQQATDISSIQDFAIKTIIKAIRQLHRTETDFNDGKYIKVILLYDDYMKSEFLEQVFQMPECDIESDDYYWLVSIEEMELLLPLWKTNPTLFTRIIDDKINRETTHSHDGRGLLQILQENKITTNTYLKQEKIAYYEKFAERGARKILGGE